MDQRHPSFTSLTGLDNTKSKTAAVCMSVDEKAMRKSTVRTKAPPAMLGVEISTV